ncbi:sodium:calcium antiporter [Alkalihalobacterium chitinilyticum]|uniref:Sodium:calcium antiporter n=1 Tax=Alkalihalobacterium chitinilyticum TaxID=2980103 RepID=A0ABT5VB01_9BACI|nr:sodium:calcium antiporter [Alkalihalobacterium chitinilyticum]MDE5412629.1 sodium:calcium antiporter [Alkalihalobacterium chitinilyticum]
MVFIIFILCAVITVICAIKLSTYADALSEKTALGGMLVGTIFLAGATSLPEVTTSITAIVLDNPDIAVGNVLGSNMFNLLILASFDLYYRRKQIFKGASGEHFYTASIGLLLAVTTLLALTLRLNITLLGVGIDTLIIVTIYAAGMYVLTSRAKKDTLGYEEPEVEEENKLNTSAISLKRAIYGFIIAAVVILVSGSFLTITGDRIAVITGLGSSFVGSFLIAATTSLPEAIAVLIAIQLRNYNLAIGSILGSNLFNMLILVGTDVLYQKGAVLSFVSPVNQITAAAVAVLSVIVLYSLLRKNYHSATSYAFPSVLLIIIYLVSSYLIFVH